MDQQRKSTEQPLPEDIREQLQRMLAQAPFNRSPVLSRFLSHAVERCLQANAPSAKEYTIGLEVFDRPDDFDPRIDTIVRVQARRLRDALTQYYAHQGQHDPVRLDMPKGQYGIRASLAVGAAEFPPKHGDDTAKPVNTACAAAPFPVPRTPLIGRDDELDQLTRNLQVDKVRLLCITGIGGSGKTRLALALADRLREAYAGGVLFVDLTTVTERSVLLEILGDLFNVRQVHDRPLTSLIGDRLRNTLVGAMLLVLDNAEGLLEGADVLGELLDCSDGLHILATSRRALRLYGEFEFSLLPLAVPSTDWRHGATDLTSVPAVHLFLSRAQAANPHADFSQDMDALAELCMRLDGLPLAIELVAAQARTLSPRQMLDRFSGHLDLPENPARDAPSRQRTVRRTIGWSYDLLDADAKRLLRRLSVFVGGFTLEAAQAVADAADELGDKLVPALNTLLAMGLVHFRAQADEPRYTMLETVRAYAVERLSASNDGDMVRQAHAAYYLVLAEEGVGTIDVLQRKRWLTSCDRDQDNFRQAIEYLLANGPERWCLRLGQALFGYWERREKLVEGQRQLQRIVDTVPVEVDPALWAKVGTYTATMTAFLGRHNEAGNRFHHLLALYRDIGDPRGEAMTLGNVAVTKRFLDDEAGARDQFAEAVKVCRRIGDDSEIAATLSNLADSELKLGNAGAAHKRFNEARELFVKQQHPLPAAWCLNHLGDVAHAEGEFAKAAKYYVDAEAEFHQHADAWGLARSKADRGLLALDAGEAHIAWPLLLDALARFDSLNHQRGLIKLAETLAGHTHQDGYPELTVKLLTAATAWRARSGFAAGSVENKAVVQGWLRETREALGDASFEASQQVGLRMTPTDVAEAIQSMADNAVPGIKRR